MRIKRWTAAVMAAVLTIASIPMSAIATPSMPRATPKASTVKIVTGSNASITLANAPVEMKVDDTVTLQVDEVAIAASSSEEIRSASNAIQYVWTSSDATVIDFTDHSVLMPTSSSNAKIKALNAGSATITVGFYIDIEGHDDWGSDTKSYTIRVVKDVSGPDTDAPTISLSSSKLDLKAGGPDGEIIATVDHATGDDVEWIFVQDQEETAVFLSSPSNATNTSSVSVMPFATGAATLTAVVETQYGKNQAVCHITVTEDPAVKPPVVTEIILEKEMKLIAGKPSQLLTAWIKEVEAADQVNWEVSSGKGIVELSDSTADNSIGSLTVFVTPVKAGNAKISAYAKNGEMAVCDVTVIDLPKITMNKTELSMLLGEETSLKAMVTPNVKLDGGYISDDEDVVFVDKETGKVTAVGAGKTTVTYEAWFGREMVDRVSCEITVTMPEKPVLILEKTELELSSKARSKFFRVTSNVELKETNFSVAPEGIVTVSYDYLKQGYLEITPVKAGTATMTVKADGLTAVCKITVIDTGKVIVDSVKDTEIVVEVDADNVSIDYPDDFPADNELVEQMENQKSALINDVIASIGTNTAVKKPAVGLMNAINFDAVATMLEEEYGLHEGEGISISLVPVFNDLQMKPVLQPDGSYVLQPTAMVFDITPQVLFGDGQSVMLDDSETYLNGGKITFRIPMPKNAPTSTILLLHDGDPINGTESESYYTIIDRETDNAYVEVTTTSFSEYSAEFKQKSTPSTGGGKPKGAGSGSGSTTVLSGKWVQVGDNWQYHFNDGTYAKAQWLVLPWNNQNNWYYFKADGNLATGWLLDGGHYFYLHPQADGNRGYMYTDWRQIDGKWYYFYPTSGSPLGAMAANTTTPDGFRVGADGAWIQ